MSTGLTKDQKDTVAKFEELRREARNDPQFAEAMQGRSYDEAGWNHGAELAKALKAAGRAREEAESNRLGTTNDYYAQLDVTWAHGKALAKSCIVQFQGHTDWLNDLGLHRRRKNGGGEDSRIIHLNKNSPIEEIISFLGTLHEVAANHETMAAILAKNGFPAEVLAQGAAEVEALEAALIARNEARAAIPRSIEARNQVFEALLKWLNCAEEAAALARKEIKRNGHMGGLLG